MSPATLSESKSKSTGPRTEEGKKRSAMNATRHGLTGRTIVMPFEDMDAYHSFCKELFEELAPATPLERQYAQTFCDTQWRLNRARSIEDSMLALGHFEAAGNIDTEHAQVHAALTSARVFRDDSQSFLNLTLYEQRLQRTLDKSLKQLQSLQAARRERSRALEQAASAQPTSAKPTSTKETPEKAENAKQPPARQFVFSNPEIEAELHRRLLLEEAENAGQQTSEPENPGDFPAKLAA